MKLTTPSLEFFKPTLATTLAFVFAWLLSVRPAQAGYTVTLQQVGPNVVATGSGAIDLTGLTVWPSSPRSPSIRPNQVALGGAFIYTGPISSSVDSYRGARGPTSFGSGFFVTSASSGSGDMVGILNTVFGFGVGSILSVPTGYVSGTALSDMAIYSGKTVASLGVRPGTYVWTWGNGADQNFTLKILLAPPPSPTPTPTPTPIPDPCYPNFTTAEGCDVLSLLTTGTGNTALGWRSLFSDSTASFNTGVGGGALALNNGSSNTAVGAAALLLNTSGNNNTAVGTDTLVFNDSGEANTATGYFALMNNTTGGSNTAVGSEALTANSSGNNNTAVGNLALQSSQTTSDNVTVGRMAGSGITTANNNIIIGHHSGVHSVFGEESDRCFIDNISGAPVSAATAMTVMVDSDGRLGTVTAERPGGSSPKGIKRQAIPDPAKPAMLNLQVEDLEATIAQNQQQIKTLTAQLKEQAAQIQKVNAQIEISKPASEVIVNKP